MTLVPETREIFGSLSAEGDVFFLCEEGEGKLEQKLEQKLPEIDILFTRLHGINETFLERARCLKGIVTSHRLTQTTESLVDQARNMCDAAVKLPATTINQDAKPSC